MHYVEFSVTGQDGATEEDSTGDLLDKTSAWMACEVVELSATSRSSFIQVK
jgi:hypothetical protein